MSEKKEDTYLYDSYIESGHNIEIFATREGKTFDKLLEEYFKMMINKEFN